ncbi:glycosyltransferase [Ampullimonas aquatilis]|uniref:glycosyltransferase n=1 Tax=Ampullimonas aquatilis TaxID=1341549 RepID=UPI003C72A471
MIPKTIHIIWVGDESQRPDNCIQTWIDHNPSWQVKVWGNDELANYGWVNANHLRDMAEKELNGVADLMRWEILYNEGGFVVDADSVCVRPLPDWLCENEAFACWENELARPGLIAAGYMASVALNRFIGQIILEIQNDVTVCDRPAWMSVGPQRLTQVWQACGYNNLTILPSHFFIPRHYSGKVYTGSGPIFAHQEWGSTVRGYEELHSKDISHYDPANQSAVSAPFITVGMVTWNRADMIGEAIDSVLSQDYEHFELLIVDDGSSDATEAVVTTYNDARIRYIKKEHSGLAATRNRALAEAQGNYIVWHDSDDVLLPNVLSDYAQLVANWPEVAVAYGDLIQMDRAGQLGQTLRYDNHAGNGHLLARLFIQNALPMPGTLVKTAVMRDLGGFDENIAASIDYDLWLRIAAHKLMFLHLGRPVAHYRWHGGNASFKADSVKQEDLYILHKALGQIEVKKLCSDLDWKHPLSAEVSAYGRVAQLLEQRGDANAAKAWREHARSMLSAFTAITTNSVQDEESNHSDAPQQTDTQSTNSAHA